MAVSMKDMTIYLLRIYTQEDLKALWEISLKSIDNYKNGTTNPAKDIQPLIIKTYNKVSENKGEKIPIERLKSEIWDSDQSDYRSKDETIKAQRITIETLQDMVRILKAQINAAGNPSSVLKSELKPDKK